MRVDVYIRIPRLIYIIQFVNTTHIFKTKYHILIDIQRLVIAYTIGSQYRQFTNSRPCTTDNMAVYKTFHITSPFFYRIITGRKIIFHTQYFTSSSHIFIGKNHSIYPYIKIVNSSCQCPNFLYIITIIKKDIFSYSSVHPNITS